MTEPNSAQSTVQLLVRSLEAQGVPFVFGIPGGAISPILDVLADGGPQFITVRHETAGAFMAQAYGRCTGRPGVVLTTSGPGLINAVCGVATAQADRDPVVAITGQVPRTMRFESYHQNLDTVGLFAPITKWSVGIDEPETIPEILANAFRVAARPARPGGVHVSVPSDVSRAAVEAQPLLPADPAPGAMPTISGRRSSGACPESAGRHRDRGRLPREPAPGAADAAAGGGLSANRVTRGAFP